MRASRFETRCLARWPTPVPPHLNSVNIATLKSTLRGHPENDLDEILIQVSAWYESVSRSGVTLPFALVPAFVGEP